MEMYKSSLYDRWQCSGAGHPDTDKLTYRHSLSRVHDRRHCGHINTASCSSRRRHSRGCPQGRSRQAAQLRTDAGRQNKCSLLRTVSVGQHNYPATDLHNFWIGERTECGSAYVQLGRRTTSFTRIRECWNRRGVCCVCARNVCIGVMTAPRTPHY